MRKLLLVIAGIIISAHVYAQAPEADKMQKYFMVFLNSVEDHDIDSARSMEIQTAHLANIRKLAEERKLVLAGPFLDRTPLRGIFIFDVDTKEEAEKLVKSDPAIEAGLLTWEMHPWYGPKALKKVMDIYEQDGATTD